MRRFCVPLTLRGRVRTVPLTCPPFDQRLMRLCMNNGENEEEEKGGEMRETGGGG